VFPSEADLKDYINAWVRSTALQSGPELAAEAEIHIREEYRTYDWIMEGFFERAGFEIESTEYGDGFQATYVCIKR